jgi:hypothetical protein
MSYRSEGRKTCPIGHDCNEGENMHGPIGHHAELTFLPTGPVSPGGPG